MQIRDFLSHEWENIGSIQSRIQTTVGFPMSEMQLRRLFKSMPGVIVGEQNNRVRLSVETTG